MVVSIAGVPGRAGWHSPVGGVTAPVTLRWHIQAAWLGGGFSWQPEVGRSVGGCHGDVIGKRWLPVVGVSRSDGVDRAARMGQGGIEVLQTRHGGWS